MKAVRLNDALHIGAFGDVTVIEAFVDDDIVKADINRAVSRNTRPNDCSPVPRCTARPQYDQRCRWKGKDDEIEIVQFPKPLAWAVVIGVEKPAGAMHDPAVHDIGKQFHANNRDQKKGGSEKYRHTFYIGGCAAGVTTARAPK